MAATVIAVPSPITKVAATPAQNRPCASAKTRTMIAPEHGRNPTATMRREAALPAARAGQLLRLRPVGMAPGGAVVMIVVVMVDDGRDRDRVR